MSAPQGDRASLRVLQVNSSDASGGAERIALRLHQSYRQQGLDSSLVVGLHRRYDEAGVLPIDPQARPDRPRSTTLRIASVLRDPARKVRQLRGIEEFDYPASRALIEGLSRRDADVLHLHNLHGDYFDLRAISGVSQRLPVIVTMHDAWLLSGHCAHSLACAKWVSGCGPCPDLTLYPAVRRDATRANWERKRDIYRHSRLHVVTPSRWLADKVERSILRPGAVDVSVINNGIHTATFSPGDRGAARHALGLPADAQIALFVATRARSNPYKDWALLRSALDLLPRPSAGPRIFLTVGEAGADEHLPSGLLMARAAVTEPEQMAQYFRAADLYVHAARADTFPSVVLEAMSCGTAVVATDIGGIGEQVVSLGAERTGLDATGMLTPRDPQALSKAVGRLFDDAELRGRLGAAGSRRVREHFDEPRMVAAYLDAYRRALDAAPLPSVL